MSPVSFTQATQLKPDLQKARDTYMSQLADLNRAKPNADDALLGSLSRLDAEMTVSGDDLVSLLLVISKSSLLLLLE